MGSRVSDGEEICYLSPTRWRRRRGLGGSREASQREVVDYRSEGVRRRESRGRYSMEAVLLLLRCRQLLIDVLVLVTIQVCGWSRLTTVKGSERVMRCVCVCVRLLFV